MSDTPYPMPNCRRCGYNLTGLAEDRCPECGMAFDRLEERRRARREARGLREIGARELAIRLLVPPLVMLASVCGLWRFNAWWPEATVVLVPVAVFLAGVPSIRAARLIARRLDANRQSGLLARGFQSDVGFQAFTQLSIILYFVLSFLAAFVAGVMIMMW